MKIYVNARFLTQPVSGVQRYGIECSRQIKKQHPDVTFLAPQNILHKDVAEELGAVVIGRNKGHLWEQVDLPLYMSRKKGAPLLNMANTAPLAYSNSYVTIHDLAFYHHPEWNSKAFATWYNILIPRIAHKSRHIFTVSATMRDELVKYYGISPQKLSVTYNGISRHMMDVPVPVGVSKEKLILSVGTFNRRKNQQNLVNAFLQSDLVNDYKLMLTGDRHKIFSESGIDETKVRHDRIIINSNVTQDELISMYQRAQIVVSLSLYEGFGIPVLEGLYNGCSIVCSDIPVYRELYDGYVTFCDPLDLNSINEALHTAAAGNGKADVTPLLNKYSYESAAKVILSVMTK